MEQERPDILRWEEAVEVLRSVDDLITSQLMNMANFEVLKCFSQPNALPVVSFDMRFFVEVMHNFCSDHETLRKVLAGEDLRLFTEEDLLNDLEHPKHLETS